MWVEYNTKKKKKFIYLEITWKFKSNESIQICYTRLVYPPYCVYCDRQINFDLGIVRILKDFADNDRRTICWKIILLIISIDEENEQVLQILPKCWKLFIFDYLRDLLKRG